MKELEFGDFGVTWGGISSLQLGLPVAWTEDRRRDHSLVDIARWMAQAPAALAGLSNKGKLAVGCDADFLDLRAGRRLRLPRRRISTLHGVTPYQGYLLRSIANDP